MEIYLYYELIKYMKCFQQLIILSAKAPYFQQSNTKIDENVFTIIKNSKLCFI